MTEVKWLKTRELVGEIATMMEGGADIPRKRLEQIREFLIYMSRTYNWMTPYLKGIHQTIDIWRPGRDEEGWKLTPKELERRAAEDREEDDNAWKPGRNPDGMRARFEGWRQEKAGWADLDQDAKRGALKAPDMVPPVPRLADDVAALQTFFASDTPATQHCRTLPHWRR